MGKYPRKMWSLCIALALIMTQAMSQPVEVQAAAKATKITLNKKSANMYVGQKITLKVVKVKPAKASKGVTWKSSNRKIATVSTKGKVTAKKAGMVKITAVSKSNKKVKAVCKIKVYKKASAIQLNVKEKTLRVKESFQLKVTKTTPAKAYSQVSYKSSNEKVATVNAKGKVTAKAVGKATITVQNNSNKKAKAVCKIVVAPANVPEATNTPMPSQEPLPTVGGISGTVTPIPTSEAEEAVLYSGSYEQTSWTINGKGHLEVNGTGDMWENGSTPEWLSYSDKILSAKINVSDAENASGMFAGCERLKNIDITNFDTSKITNMSYMFYECDSLQKIECEEFITAEVTNMRYMFCGCSSLTEVPTKSFQTDKVTGMNDMFRSCEKLTVLDLSSFNTEQITNMSGMFRECGSLLQIDVSSFDTSKVTSMNSMFSGCGSLTELDLRNFNTMNVKNMSGMFSDCGKLTTLDTSSFVTDTVTNMSEMFKNCEKLTALDLTKLTTEAVTNMNDMFRGCSSLTELDLHSFDISNVNSYMATMFSECRSLRVIKTPYKSGTQKCNLVGIWKDMEGKQFHILPQNATASIVLNWIQPTATPTPTATPSPTATPTPKPTVTLKPTATGMPAATEIPSATEAPTTTAVPTMIVSPETPTVIPVATVTPVPTSTPDSEGIQILYSGSYGQTNWTIDSNGHLEVNGTGDMWNPQENPEWLSYSGKIRTASINVVGATNAKNMFKGCSYFWELIHMEDTSKMTDMSHMFADCWNMSTVDFNNFDTSNVTDMSYMFSGCTGIYSLNMSKLDTSKVTTMEGMFGGLQWAESLAVSGFDTSNVTSMKGMFSGCGRVNKLDVSGFDTSNVTDMHNMFSGCNAVTELDVSGFDTSKVTDMSSMFSECRNITSLNLKNFKTENVTNMAAMFQCCELLETLELDSFHTSKVENMSSMFAECVHISSVNLSNFNTANVENMSGMFRNCEYLETLDVSNFDTGNVTNMQGMFENCFELSNLNLDGFNTAKVKDMYRMFYACCELQSLDLSDFEILLATDEVYTQEMFVGCYNLNTLMTPKTMNEQEISLSGTWKNGDITYTCLPTNITESLTLTKVENAEKTIYASGSYEQVAWTIDITGCLTVTGIGDMWETSGEAEWLTYADVIRSAVIDVTGATNARNMFSNCSKLKYFDGSNFDTGEITDMSGMFSCCSSLQSLDLSMLNTSKVTTINNMFLHCTQLQTLDLSSFDLRAVQVMDDAPISVFTSSDSLELLKTPANPGDCRIMLDKVMVDEAENPYLYTPRNTTGSITLKKPGKEYDMMNTYSYGDVIWVVDTEGNLEIYGTGEMYDSMKMVLTNVKTAKVKVTGATRASQLFENYTELVSVDLSEFDTSQVTDMSNMFSGCSNLKEVNVSGLTTKQLSSVSGMFSGCTSLTELDLSTWDLSGLYAMAMMDEPGEITMFGNGTFLQTLKTPKVTGNYRIPLEAEYQGNDGMSYTYIPENLTGSITLTN